jgi:4-hydroxy-tetrahydrodipicolinate synthase
MRELTYAVMDLGASGVMVAPPSTLRTDDQIVAYFEMVDETLGKDVPWVLQDHPVATGVQMSAGVIMRILRNSSTCVMLKHEDCPGLAKLSTYRAASSKGELRRVSILAGNGGGLFLPEELTRGADGAMTGFAYPEMMVGVCEAHASGDAERAHDIFDAYLPLARYEQQSNIGLAVRKHILAQRGVIASAAVRKPGPKLSAADVADIERLTARQTRRLKDIGAR